MKPLQMKSVRIKYKYSQRGWAKLLNFPRSSIEKWEGGTRNPSQPTRLLYLILDKFPSVVRYAEKKAFKIRREEKKER
jgi:DNA-binding transcriptional regulator YiaG